MNFTTYCDNKGCRKEMSPVVDKDTLVAYCTECNESLSSITEFMRRQLVSNGNIRKLGKKKLSWGITCPHCSKEGTPDINKEDKLACCYCGELVTHLNAPYAHAMKMNIKSTKRTD